MKKTITLSVCSAALLLGSTAAEAQLTGQLWQNSAGIAGNATIANKPATPADAWFNPPLLDFDSSISGYTLHDFLHNPTFYNTSGTFNPNLTANNTYFFFTGSTFLHAGVNSFVVPHDDGLQLNFNGIGMVVNAPGPTAPVNTPFDVTAPADGMYTFELSYGEVLGAPAVLAFQINGEPVRGTTPDAGSTGILLGAALGVVSLLKRRFA